MSTARKQKGRTAHPFVKLRRPTFEFSASGNEPRHGDCAVRRAPRRLEIFLNRDPRFALSEELEAKQTLVDQLRALVGLIPSP